MDVDATNRKLRAFLSINTVHKLSVSRKLSIPFMDGFWVSAPHLAHRRAHPRCEATVGQVPKSLNGQTGPSRKTNEHRQRRICSTPIEIVQRAAETILAEGPHPHVVGPSQPSDICFQSFEEQRCRMQRPARRRQFAEQLDLIEHGGTRLRTARGVLPAHDSHTRRALPGQYAPVRFRARGP